MRKTLCSRLNAIVLAVALLLPCVMTVPVMAAESDPDVLYSWTPSGTADSCAQEMVNNAVPRTDYAAIQTPAASDYGQYSNILFSATMNTAEGSRTQRFLSMYVGINAKGGLGSVEVSDGVNARRKTTEALKVTLAGLSAAPVGTGSHEAIALTHLLAVRTASTTEHGMLRDDDAVYTVHTTAGREWTVNGLRSWQLTGAGVLGTTSAPAVFYQVTSNDLLGDNTLAADEQIDRIDYYPYGLSTSMDRGGYFHLGDVQLLGYADQSAFEADYADCRSYTSVPEATLRDIVVAEAVAVKDYPWTTPNEDLIGYSGKTYAANTARTGPIYQRGSTNANDPLILLSTEAFQQMADDGQIVNRTFNGITAAPGMDCSTFVYNAISRVSATMAYTNMFYERDNSLVRLGDLTATDDQPKFTDGDIINYSENTKDEVIAAYKQLKKGDALNMFKLDSESVHAMLVYATPAAGATGVEIIEQTSNADSDTTNSRIRTVSFEALYTSKYLPYTLKEYTQGQVLDANVQLLVLPNDGSDWTRGVSTAAAASNYRILSMTATVTDGSGEEVVSVTEYGWRSRNEHQIMDVTELNDALAVLPAGQYTLTLDVVSGPKTSVGGATPVETFTQTFTVAAPEPDEHITADAVALTGTETTLAAGTTYYLNGNVTAANNLAVEAGDAVTLCLNGYTLKADSALSGFFINVPANATLTICGGSAGNGTLKGNGMDSATDLCGVRIQKNGTATLESGVITGFKHNVTSGTTSGGGVYADSGKFTMNGGTITGNKGYYGGAIRTRGTGVVVVNGGTITRNQAGSNGAAIHTAASLTINGGTIRENSALSTVASSAIYANGTGVVTINGGTITGNAGNGVYFANTTADALTLNGGTITGNNTAGTAGRADLYFGGSAVGSVSGATLGTWAKTSSAAPTLTVNYATLGTDPAGTDWITLADGVACTQQGDVWVVGDVPACTEHANATMLGKGTKILDSGTYYLAADVEALSNIKVTGDVTLCLNDHTLTAAASGSSFITVSAGADLTICGGDKGEGVISGQEGVNGRAFYVPGGDLVLESGTVTGFSYTSAGGVAYLAGSADDSASFTMNGGTLSGNHTDANGGAVYVYYYDTFTMNGGTVTGNSADGMGGAVHLVGASANGGGTFILNDGTISNNTAGTTGGAIQLNHGKVTVQLNGGSITGNVAAGDGDAMYCRGTITVDGVTITNNDVVKHTAGLNAFTITSGTFDFNPAEVDWMTLAEGSVVTKVSDTQWTVAPVVCSKHPDATPITADTTTLNSGVYYLAADVEALSNITVAGDATLCLNDHTLTGPASGGNFISVPADSKLTVCGGESGAGVISGRGEGTSAKGIYVNGGELVLDSGVITNFHNATYAGVHVYSATAKFTMNGGSITGNVATGNGGGVSINTSSAQFIMNGGSITNNTAGTNGGGVWINAGGAIVTLNGGSITGNTAAKMGGGIYTMQAAGNLTMTNLTVTGNTSTAGKGDDVTGGYVAANSSAASIPVGSGCVIGDVYLTNESNTSRYVPKMSVTDASVESVSVLAGEEAEGLLTINSGTFGFNPADGAYTGWVTLAEGTVVTKDGDNWVVAEAVGVCPDHEDGTPLNQTALDSYLVDGQYILPSGVYYLADNVTADKQFVIGQYVDVTLCLNGKTVTSGFVGSGTTNDAALFVLNGGKLTVADSDQGAGAFVGNGQSRWLYITSDGGEVEFTGGTVRGFANNTGGAIRMGTGTFTMSGGMITDNSAGTTNGGAIFAGAASKIIITGGEISGNTAAKGGAIYMGASSHSFTMTGGTVGENTTGEGYSDLQLGSYPAAISGGTVLGSYTGTNLTVTGGTFASDPTAWKAANCTVTETAGKYVVTVNEGMCPIHSGTDLNAYLAGGNTELTEGTYCLTDDVTATANLTVSGAVILCLNDHTITAPASGGNFITLNEGADLTICGGHEGTGTISGNADATASARGIYTYKLTTASLTLDSGTVTGFASTANGAGVYVHGGVTFTMNGGTISNNTTTGNGPGVFVSGAAANGYGTVVMNGGTISGNVADGTGGGVNVGHASAKFTMNGGTIANNTSTGNGGGINGTGTMTINDGTFTGNSTAAYGGAICCAGGKPLTISGGTFTGNKVTGTKSAGGAVLMCSSGNSSTVTISGGVFDGNDSAYMGGVIYYNGTGKLNITGGLFKGNTAANVGGVAALLNSGVVTVSGGTFEDNTSTGTGGVVNIASTGNVTLSGGLFKGNTGSNGGVVYVSNTEAVISITGGTYVANHATNIGGFIRTSAASATTTGATNVNITGGTYVNNTAASNNQTFYLGNGGTIAGVTVVSDSATVSNTTGLFVGGKFSADPSNRVSTDGLYSVKTIDETITVDGRSYKLTREVVEGFAESGGHVNFGSSIDASVLLVDPTGEINTADYTLTAVQTKWTSEGTEKVTLDSEFTTVELAPGVNSLSLVARGIAAKEMRDQVTYTVTDGEGTVVFEKSLSLYDIAKEWYDGSDDPLYKRMLADMLNYGAEAQRTFGYSTVTDAALPGTATDVDWTGVESSAAVTEGFEDKVAYTLSLKEKVELNVYFDGTVSESTVTAAIADGTCTGKVTTTTGGSGKTVSKVTFSDIDVVNVKENVTFTVTLDGTPVTVTYSIRDYVNACLGGSQGAVLKAMQKYVESVTAYIAANS